MWSMWKEKTGEGVTHYILVTGYRKWQYRNAVIDRLNKLRDQHKGDIVLIHGDCPTQRKGWINEEESVDEVAKEWAIVNELPYFSFPARWKALGNSAGPRRNDKMAKWLYELLINSPRSKYGNSGIDHDLYTCLAFVHPESVGTLDCMDKLDNYGLKYERITTEDSHAISRRKA